MSSLDTYPIKRASLHSTLVVEFKSEYSGHVILAGNGLAPGLFRDSWNSCWNVDEWKPYKEVVPEDDSTKNNGGDTDYYRIKDEWEMAQDIIEEREMNFSQGNIFKAAFTFNVGRHGSSTYERELNKIIYFAEREIERIKKGN